MEKKRNEVLEYHIFVWTAAKEETNSYYRKNIQDWGGDMVGAILTALVLGLYFYLKNGMEFDWLGTLISIIAGFAGVVLFRFFVALWNVPAKLYRQAKREADKYNWNDIAISYEYFENKLGCKVKIENNKATGLYFLVQIQYLELDGVREDYAIPDKSRVLLWIYNPKHNIEVKEGNWQFGFAVNSGRGIGFFELSSVVENAQDIRHRIVFCDWNENEHKRPPRRYAYFTKFAQGELKIRGTNAVSSGDFDLPYSKYETRNISENLVYRFRIDVKNNEQVMTKFEPGTFEIYADSKEDVA